VGNAAAISSDDQHPVGLGQRLIDAPDRQIDQLVYELYGLTDDEIAFVEAG